MNIKITSSHILALFITLGIAFWMSEGEVVVGGQTPEQENPPIAERVETEESELFKVSVVEIRPVEREQWIDVRGRTKADAIIPIRAETGGILERRLVERGDFVKEGDLVCVLRSGARQSNLDSANAALANAQAEYDANLQLSKQGFATDIRMRQLKATLDAAKSQVVQAEIELSRVEIKANASGIVQDPIASVGDVMQVGGSCVTLNDSDPMFFTGQVAERSVGQVKPGMEAEIKLVTGENLKGKVTYIAPAADAQTRTFATEIELDTNEQSIRDGITATARIILPVSESFKISPAWVSLSDSGQVGVKLVDDNNEVKFTPIEILSQTNDGFWVNGLKDGDRVITLGQEYVIEGEAVEPVLEPLVQAEVR